MDKTKKMMRLCLAAWLLLCLALPLQAQQVKQIQFCGKTTIAAAQKPDSIALHVKLLDASGNPIRGIAPNELRDKLYLFEDAVDINDFEHRIDSKNITVKAVGKGGGQRIGEDYTFLVLVDLNIPDKDKIYTAIEELVNSAPEGCVYLAFYGDAVTSSEVVTKATLPAFKEKLNKPSSENYFYSGMLAKLLEFETATLSDSLKLESGYTKNAAIADRAAKNPGKNFLFVIANGSQYPVLEDYADFLKIRDYKFSAAAPRVYAFLYNTGEVNDMMRESLVFVSKPKDSDGQVVDERRVGKFFSTTDMNQAMADFQQTVDDAAYDYDIIYAVQANKVYNGNTVRYLASWEGNDIGSGEMTIGTSENPFPPEDNDGGSTVMKYLMALLVALLTFAFFFIVAKIIIPLVKQKSFAVKYYKPYVPKPGVNRIICRYCAQDILPGQKVVQKCNHLMHIHCWQQNGFHCTDYGQSCKTGIQPHVDWNLMFTRESMRDVSQTLAGIVAALVSWVVYELIGRGNLFAPMAKRIVGAALDGSSPVWNECVTKVAAFLAIGLLLGFFLSFIFRYNDEYRQKNALIVLKIVGLSLLSALIGMAAFALGGWLFSLWVGALNGTVIPWYCSLPAYLLFSVCFSLSLCIGSSIPLKSALLGGLAAAVIGFIVLMFSGFSSSQSPWMTMLLNFIIYGGGLGASIATVRMMAERYFLVIQNGSKQGTEIPIHKWMNATGGGRMVTIGMIGDCEIQMNWEVSNKVAKEHAQLYIEQTRKLPIIKPLATGVMFNQRNELPVNGEHVLANGDSFQIGDTVFLYIEKD